jgi:hypothetical protein
MAITTIYPVMGQSVQLQNLWDFYFIDDPGIRFKIKTTSLPFEKFSTKTLFNGKKVYIGVNRIATFTVTIYECDLLNRPFATYNYFKDWWDQIYDSRLKVWRSYLPNQIVPLYNRTAILQYYTQIPFEELVVQTFTFNNVKLVGIEDLSNINYSEGGPLTYTVTFTCDDVSATGI